MSTQTQDTEQRGKLADFLTANRITATSTAADSNPNMEGSERMDNYKVVLAFGRRRMTLPYSKGVGDHGAEPTAAEVLDCLASDAAGFENARFFTNWCSEYGYDTDSRRAERIFKNVKRQSEKLKRFLGEPGYLTLLWETDRE